MSLSLRKATNIMLNYLPGLVLTSKPENPKIIVVGSGPAGLFCALGLAQNGFRVVLLERGQPVEIRGRDIGALVARKKLNSESNFCYGEVHFLRDK